jgi:putative transposase
VASNMRTDMVLDALEMARRSRGARRLVGLVTHADAGSQFTSVRFTERLEEIGARPSIGTVADSFDCEDRSRWRCSVLGGSPPSLSRVA